MPSLRASRPGRTYAPSVYRPRPRRSRRQRESDGSFASWGGATSSSSEAVPMRMALTRPSSSEFRRWTSPSEATENWFSTRSCRPSSARTRPEPASLRVSLGFLPTFARPSVRCPSVGGAAGRLARGVPGQWTQQGVRGPISRPTSMCSLERRSSRRCFNGDAPSVAVPSAAKEGQATHLAKRQPVGSMSSGVRCLRRPFTSKTASSQAQPGHDPSCCQP